MSEKKPEVVAMTHPDSKQTIKVSPGAARMYASQGWQEKGAKPEKDEKADASS